MCLFTAQVSEELHKKEERTRMLEARLNQVVQLLENAELRCRPCRFPSLPGLHTALAVHCSTWTPHGV